ncbi:MAG TPA: protein kinase [Streptosporangiaceae bacterium]|jgi:serine/threonine-protein kinase|nr:protein kinase [Streptosporangiaceae bacterium]
MRGTRLIGGRYALFDVLGTGGMATVWRARDEVLGREVAVKVLSPQYAADPAFRIRFEREARHVASLSHPRLVTVFDCGVDGTVPFIVMELVAGRTLRQILDDAGVLPPDDAVTIAAAVCEGLEAAHAAGVVHRDIKPANIVLSGGEVKLLDFGIARLEDSAGRTRTQAVLGTAAYLSPEQAAGRPAGPAADLYALGCVLFEMLTGTPPFTADSEVGVAYRQVHDDPGPPSARRAGVPAQLDWITTRLLAKNPAERPPGAAAARSGLLSALTPGRTAAFAPVEADTVTEEPARRSRRPRLSEVVLGGALAATLALLVTVLLTGAGNSSNHAANSGKPITASHTSHSPQPTHSPTPRRHHAKLPPVAAAAAAFVGDLQAGVQSGQVSTQAGQNMFNQLQQLLFQSPDQDPERMQQQYSQLVQVYDQYVQRGDITGSSATTLSHALDALRTAIGAH